jgi:hypothetical protein
MIDYIALGISIMAIIVCFIIHSRTVKLKKVIDEEVQIRGVQDTKLYHLINTRMAEQIKQPVQQPSYFQQPKPQPRQYPDSFSELIQNEDPNYGQRNI